MKVLVTGGGGFLGSAIVHRLVQQNNDVRSLCRGFYSRLGHLGVDQIQGNIGDAGIVSKACRGCEIVCHTAAKPPPWGRYSDYYKTNVTGTQNVINGCLRHNVSRLVYTGSPSVIFNGTDLEGVNESVPYPVKYHSFYPKTKAMAEKLVVRTAGEHLRTVVLRPHQIWGPGDPHFTPRLIARAKRLRQIGNGKNLVDTTYIENAVDAHLLAADKLKENLTLSGNIYFISQGAPIPAWQMINAILKAAELEPIKGRMHHRTARLIGTALEFIYKIFHLPGEPPMTRFIVDALATAHWFDISAARKDLGYVPRISIEEGLLFLKKWLKENMIEKR
ncbi:MAG: NAD-dependent epimerase/dehydratase family protein [Desulfobacterales bacterium]